MSPIIIDTGGGASRKWPGGMVVVRCADFLAGARGTLTTENDSLASSGQIVRDTQAVSNSIYSSAQSAFDEADDTLIIPVGDIGLEDNMQYWIAITCRIEGDWDVTNRETLATSLETGDQQSFASACEIGWYDATHRTSSDYIDTNSSIFYKPRGKSNYVMTSINAFPVTGGTHLDSELHIKAYAQSGTTIEWLIDRLYFIPYVFSGARGPGNLWKNGDFVFVGGASSLITTIEPDDGGDGGDSNGKYTLWPTPLGPLMGFSGEEGGGDYQRKSDASSAEWLMQVTTDDFFEIENTVTNTEAPASGYSVHGAEYVPSATWTNDTFGRSIADSFPTAPGDWGISPEGFGYYLISVAAGSGDRNPTFWVNGSEGVIAIRGHANPPLDSGQLVHATWWLDTTGLGGARIQSKDLIFSGKLYPHITGTSPITAGTILQTQILLENPSRPYGSTPYNESYVIVIDWVAQTWILQDVNANTIFGPNSASWLGLDAPTGWKIEIRRYKLRVKIWDASGSEPGSWDYDDWRVLPKPNANSVTEDFYPYTNVYTPYENPSPLWTCGSITDVETFAHEFEMRFDNIKVEYDAGGDPADVFIDVEHPEGNSLGTVQIPWGCPRMVYWGQRDWTADDGSGNIVIDSLSAKTWNDPSAAEMQRAEAPWWWFRSIHMAPIDLSKIRFRAFQQGDA